MDRVLKDVSEIQSFVMLRVVLLPGSYKTDMEKCQDQPDWAIEKFDVS